MRDHSTLLPLDFCEVLRLINHFAMLQDYTRVGILLFCIAHLTFSNGTKKE